ncbi:MAG: FtsX-like permease family protein [Candidatus Moranbacteria bacterium]|nr:FtsX-like permease family protein [Candidatus Moranbacteria bacterium]
MFRRFLLTWKLALANMLATKGRTFLTILGIVIGIASVMIVMSIGSSAQSLILDQVRNVGSNLIIILPGESDEDGPPAIAFGIAVTSLVNEDVEAMNKKENIPHAVAVSGYANGNALVQYGNKSSNVNFNGTSSEYVTVENAQIALGRYFTNAENDALSRVVVLGSQQATDLFGQENPIGKRISLGKYSFRVIGVLKKRGSVAFSNPDSEIFIPLKTSQKSMLGISYLTYARMKVDEEKNIEKTKQDIERLLRERHDIELGEANDFSIRGAGATLDILRGVTDALRIFLVGVASIALVVGGVGIMNILLISLKQRVRDIGLRKALGALNGDIFAQFLTESICLSLVGTGIGIVVGVVVTYVVAIIIQSLGYNWPFLLTLESVGIAFVVSLGIGIIFGWYPAKKAVKISPTEALRYE